MLNSNLSNELPGVCFFFPTFLFVKVRGAGEFWRGAGSTFLKIQLKSFTRLEERKKEKAKSCTQSQTIVAIVLGQLLCLFGVSFWDEGCSDSQHLSPSPSVLLKSTWNYQQCNNGSGLFHHVWQNNIKCSCDSTLPYWVSKTEANRTIAIAMASSSPPFWPCCWQTGHSPAWAPLQGIRGTSFPTRVKNLFILAPHRPSVLAMSGSTQLMGRCNSWSSGPEAGFSCDHRRDHKSRVCNGPKVAVMHQSPEAKETPNCDTHLF